MEIELRQVLRDRRDHAGIVRPWAELGEDRLVALDEEFDAEDAVAAEIVDHGARHRLRIGERARRHRHRLPAFAIIALLLAVADRRAEADAAPRADGEQGDLIVEIDELLDDHARPVAAHVGDRVGPGRRQLVLTAHRRLALAG